MCQIGFAADAVYCVVSRRGGSPATFVHTCSIRNSSCCLSNCSLHAMRNCWQSMFVFCLFVVNIIFVSMHKCVCVHNMHGNSQLAFTFGVDHDFDCNHILTLMCVHLARWRWRSQFEYAWPLLFIGYRFARGHYTKHTFT